jgi:hypothetical protein
MVIIHENCVRYGKEGDHIDYVKGVNIAGFVKVRRCHGSPGSSLIKPPDIAYMVMKRRRLGKRVFSLECADFPDKLVSSRI